MIAAGGAMTVGFGAKQSIDRSRLLPMIFASLGIAVSTFVGTAVGGAIALAVRLVVIHRTRGSAQRRRMAAGGG